MSSNALDSKTRSVLHVVLLVHGIRTQAAWQEMVASKIGSDNEILVRPIHYGYFDLLRFWCPLLTRRGPIKKLERGIDAAKARYPEAKLSIIAHSFGTYAITEILMDRPFVRLHRLILCGSIVPENFRWSRISNQIEAGVINECGSRDIWPLLAKSTTWGYGHSGTYGFGQIEVEDRYHDFSHSEFFTESFVETFWKPYIQSGDFKPSTRIASPRWFRWLSLQWKYLSPIGLLTLALIIVRLSSSTVCEITEEGFKEQFKNFDSWTNVTGWTPAPLISNANRDQEDPQGNDQDNGVQVLLSNVPILGFVKDRCFGNFRLAFNLDLTDGKGAAWALRVQDANHYYLFYLDGENKRFQSYLIKGSDTEPLKQKDDSVNSLELRAGRSFTIFAVVNNKEISHFITANDANAPRHGEQMELGSALQADKLPTHGSIGFRTFRSESFSVYDIRLDSMNPH